MPNFRLFRLPALLLLTLLLHGCALQTPPYSPSANVLDRIRNGGTQPVALGAFTVKPGAQGANSISLRGNPMASSVGADYAAYLAEALRVELQLAGKLDPRSTLEIGGELQGTDIAAGGISTNAGFVEARFVVKSAGQVRYDAVKRADATWDSSFVGAIAIPKAQQQYPVLVQQLLAALWADERFVAALK